MLNNNNRPKVDLGMVENNKANHCQSLWLFQVKLDLEKPMSIILQSKIILENSFIEFELGEHPPYLFEEHKILLKSPPINQGWERRAKRN